MTNDATARGEGVQPSDQATRDRAMAKLDMSVFLQAGAGTGKTSVLVGRVVEAVRSGRAALREIVAITFTEKAAGELRDRVRRELYEAQRDASEQLRDEEAKRLTLALHEVDAAHIETIHAFASSLLRERPLEAGLDPNFQVLDAMTEQLDFEESWQNWLWSEEEGAARPRIERCLRLGLSLDHLQGLAHTITEFRELNSRQETPTVQPAVKIWEAKRAEAGQLVQLAQRVSDAVERDISALVDALDALGSLPSEALEAGLVSLKLPIIRAGRNPDEPRVRCADAVERFREVHLDYVERVRVQALAEFIEVAADFVDQAALERRRHGRLSFQDLLIEARALLNQQRVRRYFRARYKFLLIDEFQDTDPLQAEIVMLLAARNDPANWREAELEPGRLFIVGDPKQSIYRFRRADIDMYAEVLRLFEAEQKSNGQAEVAHLDVNFRSRPELVKWHNHVFDALIRPDVKFANAQPEYHPLVPFRVDDGPAVLSLLPNRGIAWGRIAEAREDEAQAVARWIRTVRDSDQLPIHVMDPDNGGRRPGYRDICLLVRNRTNIELYTKALGDAGVPFHLDSGRGFFLQQEVRDAGVILRAMDDPSDEVAVVAALKSAPYSASDTELLAFANAGGTFQLRADAVPDDYEGALRPAFAQLLGLAQEQAERSLPAFVDRVLRATRLTEIQLARPDGVQRAANLQIIVQRAADFAENDVDSLRAFVRWLGQQTRTDLAEAESLVTEIEDDVVRILTIHQAKGLEFPIVVMPKMASERWRSRAISVVDREAGRIDFQIGRAEQRFETPGYAAAHQRQEVYEDAEERRLLYVAATRARDWLVLPAFFTERTRGYHDLLDEALPGWLSLPKEGLGPGSLSYRVEQLAHVPNQDPEPIHPDVATLSRRWLESHSLALEQGQPRRTVVVPSSLGHDSPKEPREIEPLDRSSETIDRGASSASGDSLSGTDAGVTLRSPLRFVESGSAGRERGAAIHDALFRANFDDWDATEKAAQRVFTEHGLEAEVEELMQHVRRTFESELGEAVRSAAQVERELPLVAVESERIMEGYVDLAYLPQGVEKDGGWVLVDYKTDQDASEKTRAAYQEQVRAYARMFASTGVGVGAAYLLFTTSGELWPIEVE